MTKPENQGGSHPSDLLQSAQQRDLLDVVDKLRSCGVSHYVHLPQIIVCGSQSSGKSSTLEAISGISFPTAEGLCTRFATELVLRRSPATEVKISIHPGADRNDEEKARLANWGFGGGSNVDAIAKTKAITGQIIEEAKEEMGLGAGSRKIFSRDVLRIECSSPDQPNLTIVDLPGLFGASDKHQSNTDSELVEGLVRSYMGQPRSIILAVVAADNAFANQPVTRFARDLDPTGNRTLGLITKPDKLDKGSESERYYVDLAQNRNVSLSLGWHVIRNRGFNTHDDTTAKRDSREQAFFSEAPWSSLHSSQLGVAELRDRLRAILDGHILSELSGVKSDVLAGIDGCRIRLKQLGESRATQREQHTFLLRISNKMTTLMKAAVDGEYTDPFFESRPGENIMDRRLRAKIQQALSEFADKMRIDGHGIEVVEDGKKPLRTSNFIDRASYIKTVKARLQECRGRELPGTFPPCLVAELFKDQCKSWEEFCRVLLDYINSAAASTIDLVLTEACDSVTKDRILKRIVSPGLRLLEVDLQDELVRFLQPHLSGHPITYNHYLTETVQKVQTDRHARAFDKLLVSVKESTEDGTTPSLKAVLNVVKSQTEPDMDSYACSHAVDLSEAYYKVALKKFVDDISVNAVETCLMQRLPGLFAPDVVWALSEQDVQNLGSENVQATRERAQVTEKLLVLEEGLRALESLRDNSR